MGNKVTYRVEFTVERRGNATRKAIEGKNLEALLRRVEKLDGFNVQVMTESVQEEIVHASKRPQLSPEQRRQVRSLVEDSGYTRSQAIEVVLAGVVCL